MFRAWEGLLALILLVVLTGVLIWRGGDSLRQSADATQELSGRAMPFEDDPADKKSEPSGPKGPSADSTASDRDMPRRQKQVSEDRAAEEFEGLFGDELDDLLAGETVAQSSDGTVAERAAPPPPPPPPAASEELAEPGFGAPADSENNYNIEPAAGPEPAAAFDADAFARFENPDLQCPTDICADVVTVYYATDRAIADSTDVENKYSAEFAQDLSFGVGAVTIPVEHQPGVVERPFTLTDPIFHFRVQLEQEDPGKHVTIDSLEVLDKTTFFLRMNAELSTGRGDEAIVFVHGFNTSFADAMRRTGQFWFDLKFGGVPILYSWPSTGGFSLVNAVDYTRDGTAAERTVPHLVEFLQTIADRSNASAIHVIAHSMGNRPVVEALQEFVASQDQAAGPAFDEVVLTAPDIDKQVFMGLADKLQGAANRITLYASDSDKAMQASMQVNGFPRAGDARQPIAIVAGIDTVDASAVALDGSDLNHTYFATSWQVMDDMNELLSGTPPTERFSLLPAELDDGKAYWRIRP